MISNTGRVLLEIIEINGLSNAWRYGFSFMIVKKASHWIWLKREDTSWTES